MVTILENFHRKIKFLFHSCLSSFPTMMGLKAFMESKSVSPIFIS